MDNLSIAPIAVEVWKKLKNNLVKPMLLALPIVSTTSNNILAKDLQSHSIQYDIDAPSQLSEQDIQQFFEHISSLLIAQITPTLQLMDVVISLAPDISEWISQDEFDEFSQEIEMFRTLSPQLKNGITSLQTRQLNFIQSFDKFESKLDELYEALYAVRFKVEADNVIIPRSYTNEESIGYTFNPEHSFDEFKKALLG